MCLPFPPPQVTMRQAALRAPIEPTLQFIFLSLMVIFTATAACPTSTPYTVTVAETITSCTITDKQVVINMGSCSACAFVYSFNTVSNVARMLVSIFVTSMC